MNNPLSNHANGGQALAAQRRTRRRLLADRAATGVVRGGGIAIIASIVAIVVFLLWEVVPLVRAARVGVAEEISLPLPEPRAVISDPWRTHLATLGSDGVVRAINLDSRDQVAAIALLAPGQVPAQTFARSAGGLFAASSDEGRLHAAEVEWEVRFVEQKRQVTPKLTALDPILLDPGGRSVRAFTLATLPEGGRIIAAQRSDGTLVVIRQSLEENLFTGEITASNESWERPSDATISHLVFDASGRHLFGAADGGQLLWWKLRDGNPDAPRVASAGEEITSLAMLLGGRTLIAGQADGTLSAWFTVPRTDGSTGKVLRRIRTFPPMSGAVTMISPSRRNKGFLAATDRDQLGLFYSTSERVLWEAPSPLAGMSAIDMAPKANGAYVLRKDAIVALDIDNPHPEISLTALFGNVWYESYPEPDMIWQSSSGTDDFEPKLSLTPLLIGTLKGTLYSLLLAVPLAVFGAMFVSHFMSPGLRSMVKPTIEIMAAMPSVVLGFLAGLWLAPRLEEIFPALLLMTVVLPLLLVATGFGWASLPARTRNQLPAGSEIFPFMVVLALGLWACVYLSEPVEALLFAGDFQAWLLGTTGLPFDQRNAIIVGLAMGFAVIPIIFAISEDAFSNVPQNLVSGSLALGANLWQTVTRVVVPTASPGIFSAIMVGFGRAVGETMIVLMATGNTPIMDWSPFNGFRTLSANIAVEIPEAPQFSTLYRVLFLAALLLFILTFVVNTAAEIVRHRLRERYGKL